MEPGAVGKSYVIHTILKFLKLCREEVEVMAISGSAAKLIY